MASDSIFLSLWEEEDKRLSHQLTFFDVQRKKPNRTYESASNGFIVNLHSARKTRKASLTNISCSVRAMWSSSSSP